MESNSTGLAPTLDMKECYKKIAFELRESDKSTGRNDVQRLEHLTKAEDTMFMAEDVGSVLDNFIDQFLTLMEDPSIRIRTFVVKFIERACYIDPTVLKKATATLVMTLRDQKVDAELKKRIIVTTILIYPKVLEWAASRKHDSEAEDIWQGFTMLKDRIVQMVESKNEGIRVYVMRFLETLIICQTNRSEFSDDKITKVTMSLNQIARDHRFISFRQLETEAAHSFKSLMDQLASNGTSLLHLISALTSTIRVCRARPEFISQTIEAFESLHLNLPPTLGTGQIKSVRKELKNNLLRLLRHDFVFLKHLTRVQNLLRDLGATEGELKRNMPDPNQVNLLLKRRVESTAAKRANEAAASGALAKKMRIEDDDYDDQKASTVFDDQEEANKANQEAINLTTDWIIQRMSRDAVTRLVFLNLLTMPDEKPPGYDSNRFQVPHAVTPEVQRDVARRLAIQFMRDGKGPGVEYVAEVKRKFFFAKQKAKQDGLVIPPTPADLKHAESEQKPTKLDNDGFAMPTAPVRVKKATLNQDIFRETKPLPPGEQRDLRLHIFKRLMDSEANMSHPKLRTTLYKSLVYAVARVSNAQTPEMEEQLLKYAISDQKKRGELLRMWIEELQDQCRGVSMCVCDSEDSVITSESENNTRYDNLLVNCLTKLFAMKAHKDTLFHRIILEAHVLTPGALLILRKACLDSDSCPYAISTLRELIIKRSLQRHEFLKVLLDLSYVEHDIVRHESIATTKELFLLESVREDVFKFVNQMCARAMEPVVPPVIWSSSDDAVDHTEAEETQWTEQYARSGLILPLHMMPLDTSLIEKLTQVCAQAQMPVKLFLVKAIDKYSTQLEQDDENFLRSIDNCPKGGEALIARLVNNLTLRTDPSPEVVRRMKALQERFSSDIRSLIPVIPGFTKEECLELVPKFVLNSTANRAVPLFFKKILRANNLDTKQPSVTVAELITKLHSLENVSKKQTTLLQNSIDVLLMDPKNEFYEESNQIVASVERLADLSNANQFVFHSISRLFEKHSALGASLTKTLWKCAEKRPWARCPEAWEAFKDCAKNMGVFAYAALLFATSWTMFKEVIEYKERDPLLGQKLKQYISTLPANQQLLIDKRVIELIKTELASETEKKDRRKGGDVLLDSGWAEPHHLSNAFFSVGRKERVEELPWLKEGVEERIQVREELDQSSKDVEMNDDSVIQNEENASANIQMETDAIPEISGNIEPVSPMANETNDTAVADSNVSNENIDPTDAEINETTPMEH